MDEEKGLRKPVGVERGGAAASTKRVPQRSEDCLSDWTLPPLLARAPVFMFSGQGAQKPGMGADLLDIPEVKGTFSCASDVLGYDVADLVLNADPDELNDTRNAQPALCVLSVGIARALMARGVQPAAVRDVQAVAGVGVKGVLENGSHALIANARYLDEQRIPYDRSAFDQLAGRGLTVSYLVIDGEVRGVVAQGDQIKPTAREAVRQLKARGIAPVMLTGDNEAAARAVAHTLGIDEFRAGLLPQDKVQLVQQRRDAGDVVMMVGDGINDAPALARADVGVAIGAGTDVAIDSADVVLVKSDPEDIVRLLDLGTNTPRKIKQNLWWGAGYNIVAIPLAAGVLAPVGILLSPAVGAVLMSLSTVIVAVNAMTLKNK